MTLHPLLAIALLTAACLFSAPTRSAVDDHGHGDSAAAAGAAVLPRFAATSESLELVGVLSGRQLTLFLDRAADNRPVPKAQIALEIGGARFKAQETAAATYELMLADAPAPGVLAVIATVTDGNDRVRLVGEMHVHEASHADSAVAPRRWKTRATWTAVGLLCLAGLVWGVRRGATRRAARRLPTGETA